jgi:hypothetical protein
MPVLSRPGEKTHPPHPVCVVFLKHSSFWTQFRYQAHYGVDLGKAVAKKDGAAAAPAEVKKSRAVLKKATAVKARGETRVIDKVHLVALFDELCLSNS